ncbi:MAG: insulinase family protein [Chitinophagales bacterium]|nr:insulinase family protein [Chitinophagales bacterium]MDW8418309.1 insulinase family protein [Chitinophagales bacterium]
MKKIMIAGSLVMITYLLGAQIRQAGSIDPTRPHPGNDSLPRGGVIARPAPSGNPVPSFLPVQRSLSPEETQELQRKREEKERIIRGELEKEIDEKQKPLKSYETVPGDPFNTHIYTLPNGLKVYMSVNKDAPRIFTLFAIKAGSKFDPPQTTGLAHYLEHMMFKGTPNFGTKDWQKEKELLDQISELFEKHREETDEKRKREIYAKIDQLSYEASKYAIPNEYDKMTTMLGAQGTNAFTSTDMTVYVNDIPSNALEKFLQLEAERFRHCVLRLFHTELETVYEEFNRNQDNDRRWSDEAIDRLLLPNHPYGTQTTIGKGEHLKNPSMVNIMNYFNTYYRPNNAAIILCGDLDPRATYELILKYFGNWEGRKIPEFKAEEAPRLSTPVFETYTGPMPEHIMMGFLFKGANTREAMMAKLVDMILYNGQAGLIDINLVQQQRLLRAYSYIDENTDYVIHKFYAEPKQGQSLEELPKLILGEIEKIKNGEFGDWVLPAIVQNLRLRRMKDAEKNDSRAYNIMSAFVHDVPWSQWVSELDEMAKVTKEDIMSFARRYYDNNYAVCFKETGEAKVHKVQKPEITPVVMNKDDESDFKKKWANLPQPSIAPKFLDFTKDIQNFAACQGKVPFAYIRNDVNKTFQLVFIYDMGTDNIRELGLAVRLLEYLGTPKFTAEQLKTEFYKLGVEYSVNAARDRVTISLSGLEDNLQPALNLLEYFLANVQPDKTVYDNMVEDILQERANAKKNKGQILFNGLTNYAKYGPVNPFNNVMKENELRSTSPEKLTELVRALNTYKHKIFYYGQKSPEDVLAVLNREHSLPSTLKDYPAPRKYPELPITRNTVLFCDFPMKQAEVVLLSKGDIFNKELYPYIYLYNEYYGSGLSSIMFQEIREKMALAYAVNSTFGIPTRKEESHYISTYVGTQADKLKTALSEVNKLLTEMPQVPQQFEGARSSVIKTMESDWITRADIYWAFDRAQKRGLNEDVRKMIYEKSKTLTIQDLKTFFDKHIKGKKFTCLVIGKKESLDMDALKAIGPVQELNLEQIFGY